jgi:hypothetical protein
MAIGGRDSTWKHGTNGAVGVNTDFTAKTMSVQPNFNADETDMTVFGDGYREFEQTFKDAEIAVTYKYDTTIFGQLAAIYNNGDTVTWELGPTGTTGGGINVKETGSMFLKSFTQAIDVGEGLKIVTQWRVSGAVTFSTFT